MSKLSYCINCGEAVEIDSFMRNFRRRDPRGMFGKYGYEWETPTYAVCVNGDCKLYGVMMVRIKANRPKTYRKRPKSKQKNATAKDKVK